MTFKGFLLLTGDGRLRVTLTRIHLICEIVEEIDEEVDIVNKKENFPTIRQLG